MSVDTPGSGDLITKTSVESMHTSVAGVINDVKQGQMGGSTLGPSQLPSLIHTADTLSITSAETVTFDDSFDETSIDTSGGWARLSSYNLDNGGTGGYELPYPGFIYAYCSLRVSEWLAFTSFGSEDGNEQVWANLWYQKDSVNQKLQRNSRFINIKKPTHEVFVDASSDDFFTVEDTISIAWLEEVTAGTLNLITITAAGNYGGASSTNADTATIANGTIGFFYIPKVV